MVSAQFEHWDVELAKRTYGIDGWGNGYFDVNERGEVAIKNLINQSMPALPLIEVIDGMRERELHMPVLLRIENIIHQSINDLNEDFS